MKKKLKPFLALALCGALTFHAQAQQAGLKSAPYSGHVFIPPNPNVYVHARGTSAAIDVDYSSASANLDAAHKQAIEYALNIYKGIISSPVSIKVQIWDDENTPGFLAVCGPHVDASGNFGRANFSTVTSGSPYLNDTFYPWALADKLNGADVNPGSPDIEIHLSTLAVQNQSFYTGTDGNCPSNKADLVSVILHELAHGLGALFTSVHKDPSSGQIVYKFHDVNTPGYWPTSYDRLITDNKATPTRLTSLYETSPLLPGYVTDNLFFNGYQTRFANGNNPVQLYTPSTFKQGSSVCHLNNTNDLYYSELPNGVAIHSLSNIDIAMLEDVGWTTLISNGIEDRVEVQNYGSNPTPIKVLTPGVTVSYLINFYDEYPTGDYMVGNSWKLEAYHAGGKYTVQTLNTPTYTSPLFTCNLNALPDGYNWMRDKDGRVQAILTAEGIDNKGIHHTKQLDIGIDCRPNEPYLNLSNVSTAGNCDAVKLTFWAAGATDYSIEQQTSLTWRKIGGVTAPDNTYTVQNLNEQFNVVLRVTASNAQGSTSSQRIIRPRCKMPVVIIAPSPVVSQTHFHVDDAFVIKRIRLINIEDPQIDLSFDFDGKDLEVEIDLSALPQGDYVVEASNDMEVATGKFTKQNL